MPIEVELSSPTTGFGVNYEGENSNLKHPSSSTNSNHELKGRVLQ